MVGLACITVGYALVWTLATRKVRRTLGAARREAPAG
jgi:hypothetical protein